MEKIKLDNEKINKLNTMNARLDKLYGKDGTIQREEFRIKALAYYYGELLKEKRIEKKLTQQELAELTGLNRPYIAKVEKGSTDIQLSSFIRLLQGLGMSLSIK